MPLLSSHIAVITGAGSGIGRAIALGYAREGARVVLLDVDEKAAAEAAQEVLNAGGAADSFVLDVTKREDCVAMAKFADSLDAILRITTAYRAAALRSKRGDSCRIET